MTYAPRFSLVALAATALLLAGITAGGCGRTGAETDYLYGGYGGVGGTGGMTTTTTTNVGGTGGIPNACGNGVCEAGESCSNCTPDCGICPGCGDGICNNGETCGSCAVDCGICQGCGDNICQPTETCASCQHDCGKCATCGDGTCSPDKGEDCASCPIDCGLCQTCGNGKCDGGETCDSCPQDCGKCTFCGDGFCTSPEDMQIAFGTFAGLPHRMVLVRELDGVRWVNDSKGTNVDATLKSLEGYDPRSVILILGGKDKAGEFERMRELVEQKARVVVTIGSAAMRISEALEGTTEIVSAGDMQQAIEWARQNAKQGETVLLSPACASFDQYRNFEHRGEHFEELVRAL